MPTPMLYSPRLVFDKYYISRGTNIKPLVYGGFVLKLVDDNQTDTSSEEGFYNLFYDETTFKFDYDRQDKIYKDNLTPIWFTKNRTKEGVEYRLRFFIPIQLSTGNTYAFAIMYFDPTDTSARDNMHKLKPLFLSNRNIAKCLTRRSTLAWNRGRFNRGWNSISIFIPYYNSSYSEYSSNNIFVPITDFSIFNSFWLNNNSTVGANSQFEGIVRNNKLRILSTNLASRASILRKLNVYSKLNIYNNLELQAGMLKTRFPYKLPNPINYRVRATENIYNFDITVYRYSYQFKTQIAQRSIYHTIDDPITTQINFNSISSTLYEINTTSSSNLIVTEVLDVYGIDTSGNKIRIGSIPICNGVLQFRAPNNVIYRYLYLSSGRSTLYRHNHIKFIL